jgi:hypothetical protein
MGNRFVVRLPLLAENASKWIVGMTPHTERQIWTTASLVLVSVLVGGFVVAYGAAAAGLFGLIDSWRVSLLALSGAAFSFVGIVGYFLIGGAELRARSANNLENSQRSV